MWVEEIGQRFGNHPFSASLLFSSGNAHIHNADIYKTTLLQPVFQRQRGRDEIDITHLRVTIAWYQHRVLITINNQRFQHQFTFIDQLIFQLP